MLAHSPRIVTENLVLLLDAANPRNFNLTAVEVLVVAGGGGGGGGDVGSGGGAGGLIYNSNFAVTPGTQLTVTVGDGGAGSPTSNIDGSNGSPSVFGSLEAIGGGGGASWGSGTGQDGGSGGGGVGGSAGGLGTAGQGFAGGTGVGSPDYPQGGGGGAGGPGQTATNHTRAGDGGIGLSFPQFSSVGGSPSGWFAGGGGGGVEASQNGNSVIPGNGGLGGGGNGGRQSGTAIIATAGSPNTGGGGGGNDPGAGGAGGSGIIIVRYPGPQKAIGGTVTSVGGDTIHTFTTSGNFTPLVNTNGSAVLGLSDLSGNRNFGDSGGSGVLYSSANGGSLSFDGGDTSHIQIVNTAGQLDFPGDFTVGLWIYPTQYHRTYQTMIDTYPGGATNGWIFTTMYSSSQVISWYTEGSSWQPSGTAVTLNDWNYVVASRIGTTVKLYKNATEIHSHSDSSNIRGGVCRIGRGLDDANNYGNVFGRISNVQIYKGKGLTAAEIQQNFNALRGRFGI